MAEETTPQDARAKVWELIAQFSAAMLVTRSKDDKLSARPMSLIVRPEERVVYILTERASQTARDIEADGSILLTFADGKRYVSLDARGSVSSDRILIERLWNPGAQAFWPQGSSDPSVCALVLRPDAGEYWDGNNALSAGVKMVIANLTGKPPNLGDHGDVRL